MSIDYSQLRFSKGTPRVLTKGKKRRDANADLDTAYAVVNERDKNICRVTGRTLLPTAVDPKQRREHHHLAGRRVKPEWKTDPKRIILVAADVHQCLQAHLIQVEGDDATKSLRFWWNLPKGEKPLFEIASRRKSQRRTE